MTDSDLPNIVKIPLTKGLFAIVDESDAEKALSFRWYAKKRGGKNNPVWYAERSMRIREENYRKGKHVGLHSFLFGMEHLVDHRNSDGLDNRRSNLRIATVSQNNANARLRSDSQSGFKGVRRVKQIGARKPRWQSRIRKGGKAIHLGYFDTAIDAARAYNVAALAQWGEFARLNVLPG